MRRVIAVFMLVLLPFQLSWPAVAAYCMHESATTQVQHVGHHEHKHEANSVVGQADKNGQNTGQSDVDCWVCHGTGIGALHFAFAKQNISRDGDMGVQPNERVAEVTPSPPDRPQWPVLA